MYQLIKHYLIRAFFSWLLIFAVFKSLFLIYHWDNIENESIFSILKVFKTSLKLDIASTSFILMLALLLAVFQYFFHTNKIKIFSKYYHLVVLAIISILNVSDIILYDYWASKISLKSLTFLSTPQQIVGSIGYQKFFMGVLFVLLHFFVGKIILEKYYFNKKLSFSKSTFSFIFFFLISLASLIIGARGGLQVVPINQSDAYFSKNYTLNIAGINPLWNFVNVFVENNKYATHNPYIKLEKHEAENIVNKLYSTKKDTSIKLFNIQRPNIVFVVLEGVNANVFKSINRKKSYAPNIESLFEEAYTFSNMYSAGTRSDEGMVSILSGFPPLPISSVCTQTEKYIHLPSFPNRIAEVGYNSSFYFGGEASFGNFKSYLIHNGFDPLIEVFDYPSKYNTQYLGVPDEFVFQKFTKDMRTIKEPFFSMIFTQTTHEPFDMPFNENVDSEREKYLNTVEYVDSIIGDWYQTMKIMPWYDNTIFIISSDHAHYLPGNYKAWTKERYHIPFLILGEPLKNEFKGKENTKIFSQTDIPKSILAQLGLKNNDFVWSKDFMNPYSKEFAYFTFNEGYTVLNTNTICGYDCKWDKIYGNCDSLTIKKQGQAILQVHFEEYLSY